MSNNKNTKKMKTTTAKIIFNKIEIVEQPKGKYLWQLKIDDESVVAFYDKEEKEKYLIMYGRVWYCDKNISELFTWQEIAKAIIINQIF